MSRTDPTSIRARNGRSQGRSRRLVWLICGGCERISGRRSDMELRNFAQTGPNSKSLAQKAPAADGQQPRTAFAADTGRSALPAGTALHAPLRPLATPRRLKPTDQRRCAICLARRPGSSEAGRGTAFWPASVTCSGRARLGEAPPMRRWPPPSREAPAQTSSNCPRRHGGSTQGCRGATPRDHERESRRCRWFQILSH